jgi:hypothetical protein
MNFFIANVASILILLCAYFRAKSPPIEGPTSPALRAGIVAGISASLSQFGFEVPVVIAINLSLAVYVVTRNKEDTTTPEWMVVLSLFLQACLYFVISL